ncbi:hypothetical protein PMPD1_3456 [Paramixta manurensis]|uniref:Uncharacterized protein n=1 Tax=Paramixta manurensis TaxID=2740817 RepID=A0A6M8UTG1_9GAMM|nr:hypothetical protein PMPD1_3456 [Erwiniaceae bacterium PD-1]
MKKIITIAVFFLVLGGVFLKEWKAQQATKADCISEHHLYHDNHIITARYHWLISQHGGSLKINGTFNDNGIKQMINREVTFSYKSSDERYYHITTKKIHRAPSENVTEERMRAHYPPFILQEQAETVIRIERAKKNNLLIYMNTQPAFLCAPTKV